jgi:hypothetical protein
MDTPMTPMWHQRGLETNCIFLRLLEGYESTYPISTSTYHDIYYDITAFA